MALITENGPSNHDINLRHLPSAEQAPHKKGGATPGGTGMNLNPKYLSSLPTTPCPSPPDTARMESLPTDVTDFQHLMQGGQ